VVVRLGLRRYVLLAVVWAVVVFGLLYGAGSAVAAALGAVAGAVGGWKLREYLRRRSRLYRRYFLGERE
jgi:hypothetical protein